MVASRRNITYACQPSLLGFRRRCRLALAKAVISCQHHS